MSKKIISNNESVSKKIEEVENIKSTTKFWNITKEQGEYLSQIISIEKPNNILEIGTSNGYSTLWLAKNLKLNSHITTIEVDDVRFEIAKKNFNDANISQNITQIKGEITQILNENKLNKEQFDLIFLDAMQREYLNIIKTIEQKNLLTNNAIIIADNVLSHGNMKEFIEYMQKNYTTKIIDIGGGFLIARVL